MPPCVRTHARRMLHPMHDYPFPWKLVWHAQALATAKLSVNRSVCILCLAYWAGGCSAIPDDRVTLAALIKLPHQAVQAQETAVLQAFETIRPALDRTYRAEDRKHQANVRRGLNMVSKAKARKANAISAATLPNPEHMLPRREQVNVPEHVIADRRQKSSGKSTASLFTD